MKHRLTTSVLCAVVSVAITAEALARPLRLRDMPEGTPDVYAWLAGQPSGVLCEYPVHGTQGRVGAQNPTYMYFSTFHWHRLLNGYSGFFPPSYVALVATMASFPSPASIQYLQERRVDLLLVHSAYYIKGDFQAHVAVLDRNPDLLAVATFTSQEGTRKVYRVRRKT